MSQFLTLDQVKLNLKVDHDDENDHLEFLINAAFDAFEQTTNRKLYEASVEIPENVANGIHISDSITHGAHMLIAHWYKNRESVGVGAELPLATQWLWKRHRLINT